MVTITDSRIRNNVYETVYDLVNGAKASFNASSTPTVIGGHPDITTITFPTIIINPVEVGESEFTSDRSSSLKDIAIIIEVYAKTNKDLDNIADGVTNTLRGGSTPGMFLTEVNEDNGITFANDSQIKQKTITLMYKRR